MTAAPRPASSPTDELDRLKSLLFNPEARRLDALESGVERLDSRVGAAERLERATAEIIVEALRRAEVARHRELADAIAPVVVASIRSEIRNSRDEMVDALYPLTGQLVAAAVSNAFRDLVANIDQKLNALTSLDRWKLRLRALVGGRPASELALATTLSGTPRRLFFMERGSGRLIASWRAHGGVDERADLVGGLITALTGFAREALGEEAGDLRTLEFGGREVYLRSSQNTIVAAEFDHPMQPHQLHALDAGFLDLLARYQSDGANDSLLADFANSIERAKETTEEAGKARRKGMSAPLKIALVLILAALAWWAWGAATRWRLEARVDGALRDFIATHPHLGAFPLAARTQHGAARVDLSGLAPTPADADALVSAVRAAATPYELRANIGVMATTAALDDITRRLAAADARLQAVGAQTGQLATQLASQLAAQQAGDKRIEGLDARVAQLGGLNDALASLRAQIAALSGRLDTPRERLRVLLDGFALFFAEDGSIVNEEKATPTLDAIAALLRSEPLKLRIIGHTDSTGSIALNRTKSRERADAALALLVARGAPREKLLTLARSDATPVAESDTPARIANRRVTFEPLLEDEPK